MANTLKAAFAVGILLFGAALFVPPLADATQENATDTLEVANGTDTDVTERLTAGVIDVNENAASPDNVTVEYTNNRTLETSNTTVDVGNQSTVSLSSDDINTTVNSIDGDSVQVAVEYPPMFGWDSAPRTFFANIELVIVLLGVAIIVGSVAVVLK